MSSVTEFLQGNKLIDVDESGQITQPVFVLSSRGGNKIGVIKNVSSINITHPLSDVAELSFDVTKEANGEVYEDWDKLKDFKLIQMPYDNSWYEAKVDVDEEDDIVKHVTCVHANEAELGQLNLYETEINTENDIARDDYEETFFYDDENPKASLLHRILKDKAPHYQIFHVDDSLKGLFRVFSFNGTSIQDALNEIAEEVNCLFIYGEWYENDGKYHRTISAYDLEDYCNDCHKRGEYTEHVCTNCGSTNIVDGYGEDTGIFISRENLATSISYESNTDDVKNCFRLSAGDDTMTSAIKSCNPSMSQYMWYFSDDMLEDMSIELATKIVEYESLVESYKNDREIDIPSAYIDTYNTYIDRYGSESPELVKIETPIIGTAKLTEAYYNAMNLYGFLKTEMMPYAERVEDTNAEEQMDLLRNGGFTEIGIASISGTIPYTTANSAIQSYAKVFIDTSRYKVSAFTDNIVNTTWNGTITITAYADDEDTASDDFVLQLFDGKSNEKYAKWLEQSVQKTMASREVSDLSVINLFKTDESLDDFKTRLKKYSLDYLDIMSDMATSAITIMSEQGVASKDSLDKDVYKQLYTPYLQKSRAIQNEIATRERELSLLLQPTDDDGTPDARYQNLGLLDIIVNKQDEIRNILDLHGYIGDELWEELSFYRREDEYSNSNYISDGLTDSEVIEQAKNFVETASKEIVKAATLQHTISAPLMNFLLMDEFESLQENFKVGNWIHLQVDGKVYKLRLANWEVDYDDIDNLDIEFTDAIRVGGIISDVESILSKSRSMATTYDYTAHQADKGKDASSTVKFFRDNGIDFSKVKAITSKGNTNIVYDDDGILLKRVDGFEELPEQARIYNNGIYITKDAWETVSTGLGHFSYVDPETGETVETYGIVADTVIGKLILGEDLKIYSESNRFEMGDDGLVVTARSDADNEDLFTIQKDTGEVDESGKPIVEKYIYVDQDGNINITGTSIIVNGVNDSYKLDDARRVASNYLSADSTGIMIADMRNGTHDPSSPVGRNILLTNTGVNIRNGSLSMANFSDNVRIGREDSSHINFDVTHMSAYNGGNIYYDVGDGSTLVSQSYKVGVLPLTISASHVIEEILSLKINNVTQSESSYSFVDETSTITINDRPPTAISISVNYTYLDGNGDLQEVTQSFSYNSVSLTFGLEYPASTIYSVSHSPYTISGSNITFSQRPTSGTVITIQYRLAKSNPYFTFNTRGSGVLGSGSASFGNSTVATGESSFVIGMNNTASGKASFATGRSTTASADSSSAFGIGATSAAQGGMAVGTYNVIDSNKLFSVGNGTYSSRSNAFSVDKSGNVFIGKRLNTKDGSQIFLTNTYTSGKVSIAAGGSYTFSVSIKKTGYAPIAFSYCRVLGTGHADCYIHGTNINITENKASIGVKNMGSVARTVYVNFRIFFIATAAMW